MASAFLLPAVGDQPARAFRQIAPQEQDGQADRGADEEGGAPADLGVEPSRIEEHQGAGAADCGPHPEAAADHQIRPAAIARRDQFLDCRVDRAVFAADAGAGEKAHQQEGPQVPGERRAGGGQQVEGQRDVEQPLAAQPVGEPAEEQRPADRPRDVGAAGKAHLGRGEMQDRALPQRPGQRARECHLQPVQHPGDAEPHHHHPVEPAPWQALQPRGDDCLQDRTVRPFAAGGRSRLGLKRG